jgi:hypothetical protein
LHDPGAVSVLLRKPYGECLFVFEAGYARNALSQFDGGSAWPRADFQKVTAQIRAA